MSEIPELNPALKSWVALNNALRGADEDTCLTLIAEERRGRKRPTFLRRIYARLNKARADRERAELDKDLS